MSRTALALLLALTAFDAGAEETPPPVEEVRFVLQVRGQDAGYGFYRETRSADGTSTIEGETLLKLLEGGGESVVRSKRTTVVGPDDAMPREYRAVITRSGEASEYFGRVAEGRLVVEAKIRGTPAHAAFAAATAGGLIDYNAPEHFEIFLRGRLKSPGPFRGAAVILEMMSALPLAGRVLDAEEVAVDGGEKVRATRVEFSALGMLYRAWLDEHGRLARIEVPSQNFVGVRTQRRIEELTLRAADLVRSFSVPLRVAPGVADPGELRHPGAVRSARFRVRVKVGDNRTDPEALTNPHQTFSLAAGSWASEGWVDGTLAVTPQLRAGRDGERPALGAAAAFAPFLAPEDGIEADAPEIVATARALAPEGAPPLALARAAADWVHASMRYETQLVSALAAHQGKVGDCLSMSRLTIALLRARGVPARTIGGIALGGGKRFGQHHWVEVFGGPDVGWLQIDPTYGQSEGVDAFHLDLWRQGTLDGAGANEVVLEAWEPR